jgi:hypothetical protein
MVYEKRLLLYADILGWTAETMSGNGEKALAAVMHIQRRADEINQRVRDGLKESQGKVIQTDLGPMHVSSINPMFLEVQFGAFSDHFVWSLPAAFSYRILSIAVHLILDLLRGGFLTRGAIVLKDLYHRDNVIFGPALLQAVEMEEGEAFYPRILISETAVEHFLGLPGDEPVKTIIKDQTGRFVVNPFIIPFSGPDEMTESFVNQNLFIAEVKSIIEAQILDLENRKKSRYVEKWRYYHQFLEGPVLDSEPKLRPFWHQ